MGIISKMRKQKAVYWPPEAGFDITGNPKIGEPEEIDCRWEDINEQFVDALGNELVSSSVVYVDREVELGGYLLLGEIDQLVDVNTPPPEAKAIRKFGKLPNLKATEFLLTVHL